MTLWFWEVFLELKSSISAKTNEYPIALVVRGRETMFFFLVVGGCIVSPPNIVVRVSNDIDGRIPPSAKKLRTPVMSWFRSLEPNLFWP